jgi:hypothetical protein
MFFANALKDYATQLHDLAVFSQSDASLFSLLKILVIYLVDSIKFVFIYIVSCRWLSDFIELPCYFQSSYIAVLKGGNPLESYLHPTFFEFFEPEIKSSPSFLLGVFNSFFLALPVSVPHLLTLRAFLLNGLPAGVVAAAGTIFGQITFYSCVLFGLESFLTPFVKFEPFNYILGFAIVVNVLYTVTHNSTKEVLRFYPNPEIRVFLRFFVLNFILAWTEQSGLFLYFGNLTFHNLPTLLQGTGPWTSFLAPTLFYLAGLLVGSIGWTLFFGFLVTLFLNRFSQFFNFPFLFLKERIHRLLLVLTFTLCFTTVPYYGFDYLISAPLGFVSQDKALQFMKAKTDYITKTSDERATIANQSINPIPFDRASQMENFSDLSSLSAFEDSSLDSEYFWKNRLLFTQAQRGAQTSRKSSQSTYTEAENDIREVAFLEAFRQPSPDGISQKTRNLALENLEKDVDKLASQLFNPLAYDYYNLSSTLNRFDSGGLPSVRQAFRERFYKNPVYKALVHLDMGGFLQGQPPFLNLTSEEERLLFERQILLQDYVKSVFDFKKGDAGLPFEATPNSYAEKVYNQQFKGSLDLVRHYFSVYLTNFEESGIKETAPSKKVLKFDQPLFKNSLGEFHPFLHEELEFSSQKQAFLEKESQGRELFSNKKWNKEGEDSFATTRAVPSTESTPFYMGWDSSLRKFLVKNPCIPGLPLGTETFTPLSKQKTSLSKTPFYLGFQAWPNDALDLKKITDKNVSIAYTPLSKEGALEVTKFFELNETQLPQRSGAVLKLPTRPDLLNQKKMPTYDWRWFLATSASRPEFQVSKKLEPLIDLKNTLPPQLGGISWPGEGFGK